MSILERILFYDFRRRLRPICELIFSASVEFAVSRLCFLIAGVGFADDKLYSLVLS